ncbi:MAG: hypothetical protein ACE5GM_10830, partial [bacterium]
GSKFTRPPDSSKTEAKKPAKPAFNFKKPGGPKPGEKTEEKKPSVEKKFSPSPKFPPASGKQEQPEDKPEKRKWNFGPKTVKKEDSANEEKQETLEEQEAQAPIEQEVPAVEREASEKTEPASPEPVSLESAEKEKKEEISEPDLSPEAEVAEGAAPAPSDPSSAAEEEKEKPVQPDSQAFKAEECAAPFIPAEEQPPSPFGRLDIFERNKLEEQDRPPADISPGLTYQEGIEIWSQRFKGDLEKLVDAYARNLVMELDKIFDGVKVPRQAPLDPGLIKERVKAAEDFIDRELKAPDKKGFLNFMKKAKEEAEKLREREKALKD